MQYCLDYRWIYASPCAIVFPAEPYLYSLTEDPMAPRKNSSSASSSSKAAKGKSLKALKLRDVSGPKGGKRTNVRDANDRYA